MTKIRRLAIALAMALVSITLVGPATAQAESSAGKEFWLAFDVNYYDPNPFLPRYLKFYIAGSPGTTGTVEITGLGFSQSFTIGASQVAEVEVPQDARGVMDSPLRVNATDGTPGATAPIAVHITASDDVTIYGMNRQQFSTDAYLALPIDAVGLRYRIVDYGGIPGGLLSVVPTQDNTTIHIEPPASTGLAAFNKTLALGDVFEWETPVGSTLTGTLITSDKPVSVYGGNRCINIPAAYSYCDHIIEQMAPTNTWGRTFVTYPLALRTADTFRIVADLDGTEVVIQKGGLTEVKQLNAGEYYEFMTGDPMAITSNNPIIVAQYSNGTTFDHVVSDPFMVLIPSYEQGFTEASFSTPISDPVTGDGGFTNYVNITVLTANTGDVLLDGMPIPAANWTAIPGSDYSGTSVAIAEGVHHITSVVPILTVVYGYAQDDSYGYPGGLLVARIADAVELRLEPSSVSGITGTQLCATATLLDDTDTGISGARIDVTVTGVVTDTYSLITGPDGTVEICQTSAVDGTAVVTVAQANLNAQGSFTWAAYHRVNVVYVDDDTGAFVAPLVGKTFDFIGPVGATVGFTLADAVDGAPVGYEVVSIDNVDVFGDTDLLITVHVRQQHKVSVVYVDDSTGGAVTPVVGTPVEFIGLLGASVGFTLADAIAGTPDGYELVSIDNVDVFGDTDLTITVHLRPMPPAIVVYTGGSVATGPGMAGVVLALACLVMGVIGLGPVTKRL